MVHGERAGTSFFGGHDGGLGTRLGNFVKGVFNAVVSDATNGLALIDPDDIGDSEEADDVENGQTLGHAGSFIAGVFVTALGLTGAGGGILAAPESNGLSLTISGLGVEAMNYGLGVSARGYNGLISKFAKEKRRTAKEHTTNKHEGNRNKHEEANARRAKEQKAADERYAKTKKKKKK